MDVHAHGVPMSTEDSVLVIVSSHDGERQAHATIEDDYDGVRLPWIHDGAARSDAGGRIGVAMVARDPSLF